MLCFTRKHIERNIHRKRKKKFSSRGIVTPIKRLPSNYFRILRITYQHRWKWSYAQDHRGKTLCLKIPFGPEICHFSCYYWCSHRLGNGDTWGCKHLSHIPVTLPSLLGDESLIAPEPECNFDNPPRKEGKTGVLDNFMVMEFNIIAGVVGYRALTIVFFL